MVLLFAIKKSAQPNNKEQHQKGPMPHTQEVPAQEIPAEAGTNNQNKKQKKTTKNKTTEIEREYQQRNKRQKTPSTIIANHCHT